LLSVLANDINDCHSLLLFDFARYILKVWIA